MKKNTNQLPELSIPRDGPVVRPQWAALPATLLVYAYTYCWFQAWPWSSRIFQIDDRSVAYPKTTQDKAPALCRLWISSPVCYVHCHQHSCRGLYVLFCRAKIPNTFPFRLVHSLCSWHTILVLKCLCYDCLSVLVKCHWWSEFPRSRFEARSLHECYEDESFLTCDYFVCY
mgnify:CR=1 FL=1